MSESLAWEKWSTFSHNRYVEEAERFSQPGSVAQKKAFFEAHYKKLAARKAAEAAAAAALVEQANAASENGASESEPESVITTQDFPKTTVSNSQVVVDEMGPQNLVLDGNGHQSNVEKMENFDSRKVVVTDVVTGHHPVSDEKGEKVEIASCVGGVNSQKEVKEAELNGTAKTEKCLTKVTV